MGRRHLAALTGAGYAVDVFDPSDASRTAALADIGHRGIEPKLATFVDAPNGSYDLAVFAEHADLRFANVAAFLAKAKAARVLLEKPLASDPDQVEKFAGLFASHKMDVGAVFGNFIRRAWPSSSKLKALCDEADFVTISVHGGAYGLANNGIHHFDYFLYLTGETGGDVRYVSLFPTVIPSGRGERFRDFGGQFIVENRRGLISGLGVPTSSVAPVVTIEGPHFYATIDERTLDWTLAVRNPSSSAPFYRCGFEYEVIESGPMNYIAMDKATALWADGAVVLPDLTEALAAHRLLHAVLEAGGAPKPYCYT